MQSLFFAFSSFSIAGEVAKVNPSRDIFLATTFLLDERGVIRWAYRPDTYRMRASVDEIVATTRRALRCAENWIGVALCPCTSERFPPGRPRV
jgi:hypothetical protein